MLTHQRKLLLCALSRNNPEAALSIVQGMSPNSWKEPMTAYLAFKVAIRIDDRDLAERCLQTVSSMPDYINYLGACIAESQHAGDVYCTVAALRKLQEKYEYNDPNPIHLPALFRSTIRLLNMLVEKEAEKDEFIEELCNVFDAGKRIADSRELEANYDSGSGTREQANGVGHQESLYCRRNRMVWA